jgi:hypothetical protein
MSKIERGQFSSLLRRYLGMTGVSDVIDELGPEIAATLTLEAERPEWEYLKGAKLMSLAAAVPAVGGVQSAVRLRNPANSGVVAIFNLFVLGCQSPTALNVSLGPEGGVDLATIIGTTPRDTRQPGFAVAPGSALIASIANVNPGGFHFIQLAMNDAQQRPYTVMSPCVLTPGFQLNAYSQQVNISLTFTFHWLEKRFDPLETQ